MNAKVGMQERIVLPRLSDLVKDVLDLLAQTSDDSCDFLISDFESAFKQLGGEALDGFFLFKVLLFEVKAGPLV